MCVPLGFPRRYIPPACLRPFVSCVTSGPFALFLPSLSVLLLHAPLVVIGGTQTHKHTLLIALQLTLSHPVLKPVTFSPFFLLFFPPLYLCFTPAACATSLLGHTGSGRCLHETSSPPALGLRDHRPLPNRKTGDVYDKTTTTKTQAMGLKYNTYLDGGKIYGCKNCKTHLADHDEILSRVSLQLAIRNSRPKRGKKQGRRERGEEEQRPAAVAWWELK